MCQERVGRTLCSPIVHRKESVIISWANIRFAPTRSWHISKWGTYFSVFRNNFKQVKLQQIICQYLIFSEQSNWHTYCKLHNKEQIFLLIYFFLTNRDVI